MIEINRKDLAQDKLNDLLSTKIDKLIGEYLSDRSRSGLMTSQESIKDLQNFLSKSKFLDFLIDGRLDYCGAKLSFLTIDDLITNDILDEKSGVYHICYDAHQDFYGVECRLLGIYSSLSSVRSQIDRLKEGKDESKVVSIDELTVKFVMLDDMIDVYLDGYFE